MAASPFARLLEPKTATPGATVLEIRQRQRSTGARAALTDCLVRLPAAFRGESCESAPANATAAFAERKRGPSVVAGRLVLVHNSTLAPACRCFLLPWPSERDRLSSAGC